MFGRRPVYKKACFPNGCLGFAIGDVHGRADLLLKMLDKLEEEAARSPGLSPVAVFLGDYIDRGMESAKVVEILLSSRLQGFERVFLRGNHEQSMTLFLEKPDEARGWLAFGGVETLISYGVRPVAADATDAALKDASAALSKALPQAHLDFFQKLRPSATYGDYFFAHAGVDPERSAAEQTEQDLYWIRDRFLNSAKIWEKVVVHGHTPVKEAYRDHRRIGVDTGAYATGRLTAARFEANEVAFVTV